MIQLPAPTAWPLVLAFGLALVFASLVTNVGLGVLGCAFAISGCIGWFRQVLPLEQHEQVIVPTETIPVVTARRRVARIELTETHRARLPLETYSLLSGVKGGIAGGIAMIIPALLYGWLSHRSIWYPVNLLGGAGVGAWKHATTADIARFHWNGLIAATIIHAATSVLVGLLYGALLPILPRRPILLGGIVAPLLWTGLLYSTLGIINPFLGERIQWGWFIVSQIAFGLVAGLVVSRQERVRTAQYLSVAQRMGLESPGLMPERGREDRR